MILRDRADPALDAQPDKAFDELVQREQQRQGCERDRPHLEYMDERRDADGADDAARREARGGRETH